MENGKSFIKKWGLYYRIHSLQNEGYNILNISQILKISRNTIYKYLGLDEREFLEFLISQKSRKNKLEDYKNLVLEIVKENCDKKKSFIYEEFVKKSGLKITYKTFSNYIKKIQE